MSARSSLRSASESHITTQSDDAETPRSEPRLRSAHFLVSTTDSEVAHGFSFPANLALESGARAHVRGKEGDMRSFAPARSSSSSTVASRGGSEGIPEHELLQRQGPRVLSQSDYSKRSSLHGRVLSSNRGSSSRAASYERRESEKSISAWRSPPWHGAISGPFVKEEVEERERDVRSGYLESPPHAGLGKFMLESEYAENRPGNDFTGVEELRNDEEGIDLATAVQFDGKSEPARAQHTADTKEEDETDESVVMERMNYNAPEDPRNYIINMIVNSSSGSVTLDYIRYALQWEEHYEEVYDTVFEYLQGYQLIFAVSPIDNRVTLRRPPLTMKGPRSGRWQKRGEQLVADHIGSVSYSCVGEAFDLDVLLSRYKRRGYESEMIHGVLHVWSPHVFDLFLFSNGVVVWWGLSRRDHWIVEDDFLTTKHSFISDAVKGRHRQKDIDELFPIWCSYEQDEGTSKSLSRFAAYLSFDHYLIPKDEPTRTHVMLTVSYSLSRSAVVDFFEHVTQYSQKRVLAIPSELKGIWEYFSSKNQILHLEGELRLASMVIMTLRDTPSFLWEMSWLEDYYELIEKHTSSEGRLSWFSARSDALLQQLNNIKTRRFCLFILGSDVFLVFLLVADVVFLAAQFVIRLYFSVDKSTY